MTHQYGDRFDVYTFAYQLGRKPPPSRMTATADDSCARMEPMK
jgi:hypothetical protein